MSTDLPDVGDHRITHDRLRRHAHDLADAIGRLAPVDAGKVAAAAERWAAHAADAREHHRTEDDVLYPALVDRVPSVVGLVGRAGTQHRELEDLIVAIDDAMDHASTDASVAEVHHLVQDWVAALVTHLDLEETELLPLVDEYFFAQ